MNTLHRADLGLRGEKEERGNVAVQFPRGCGTTEGDRTHCSSKMKKNTLSVYLELHLTRTTEKCAYEVTSEVRVSLVTSLFSIRRLKERKPAKFFFPQFRQLFDSKLKTHNWRFGVFPQFPLCLMKRIIEKQKIGQFFLFRLHLGSSVST